MNVRLTVILNKETVEAMKELGAEGLGYGEVIRRSVSLTKVLKDHSKGEGNAVVLSTEVSGGDIEIDMRYI